ncbi:acyltransferase family protein [Micromonospora chokoriensis]|uniref:acyltransferase family protein n=1 Tax=Micromonospora chokoriensis TaxID=356851 RepID=UPI0012FE36BD|nr:acyltransferase [Micromonospora chokoriensis]
MTGVEDTPDRPAVPPAATPRETPSAPSRRSRSDRLYILDLLRFCAAVAVLGFHVFVDNDNRGAWGKSAVDLFGEPIVSVFRYGWMGVEFFFVISGFVICMSCWGRSVADFAISRVTRLMPAYVFAVLATSAALTFWPLDSGPPQPSHVLINATMLQTFVGIPNIDSVYWTLFVELKFYLLFAVVVWFGLTYKRVVLFCVLWMTAALYAEYSQVKPLIQFVEAGFAPYFVAGIALYLIYRFGPNLVAWGIFGTSMVIGLITLGRRVDGQNADKPVVSFEVALPVMFLFFALMAGVALGWFSWFKWRGLTVIGALTYPVYLLHMQFSRIVVIRFHDSVSPWLLVAAFAAGVLLLAYLTNRFVERPLAKMLRRQLRKGFAEISAKSASGSGSDTSTGPRTANSDQYGGSVSSGAASPVA